MAPLSGMLRNSISNLKGKFCLLNLIRCILTVLLLFSAVFMFFLSLDTILCVVNAPATLFKTSTSPVHHISAPVGELGDFHLLLGTMLTSSAVVCVSFRTLYPRLHMPAMFERFLGLCGSSVCNIAPLPDRSTGSSHFEVFQCICRYSRAICNALCVHARV